MIWLAQGRLLGLVIKLWPIYLFILVCSAWVSPADLSSLGLLLMLYSSLSLCLILSILWLSVLSLATACRPHDRSAGSKLVIYDPYSKRGFSQLDYMPLLSFTSQGLLLAWNHIVDQLLLQKLHSFGILNLSSTFVTFWSHCPERAWTRIAHPPAIPSLSLCFITVPKMGRSWLHATVFSDFLNWHLLYLLHWNWNISWSMERKNWFK